MAPLSTPWLDSPTIAPTGPEGGGPPPGAAGQPPLRQALDAVGEGVVLTDHRHPDHPILHANAAFERITGYSAAEVLGRGWGFLRGPDTDPLTAERVRAAVAAGQPCAAELLHYRKDGRPFWGALSLTPLPGPG